jgi:hypothetical protein
MQGTTRQTEKIDTCSKISFTTYLTNYQTEQTFKLLYAYKYFYFLKPPSVFSLKYNIKLIEFKIKKETKDSNQHSVDV